MAVEFKTPAGIIIPSSVDLGALVQEGKSDRSAGAQVRAITGGFASLQGGISRFREYQNYLHAIKIPWVFRCVMRIAESFASANWDLMDETDTAIVTPSNPFLQLMARPNPVQSGFHFLEYQQVFMEILGEVFISLEAKDAAGRPRELYALNPAYVTVIPDPDNYVKGYIFNPQNVQFPGVRPITYDPDEIIHIKLPNPMNPYRGFGPVEASATVLEIIEAMAGHELGYYRSGGRIVGVLETEDEVDDDDFEKIKQEWRAFSSDQASRLKTAILQAGLKYTPIAEGMRAINQTEINKEKRDTILGTWGVPPTKLGILENAQYKLNDADQTFESETMMPKKQRFADALQPLIDLFDPDWRMDFERKNFEDDSIRLTNTRSMAQNFAFTLNDIRKYAGWPEIDGGDVILVPTQMIATKPEDMESFADVNLDEAENPPEPPTPPGANGSVPLAPEDSGSGGSNNGTPGNGAAPKTGTASQAPKATTVKKDAAFEFEIKEMKSAFTQAGEIGERDDQGFTQEQRVIGEDILRKMSAAKHVSHRFARRSSTDTKARRARRVSSTHPALGAAKLEFRARYLNHVKDTVVPEIKRAFKAQSRKVFQGLEDLLTGAKKAPEKERRAYIEKALANLIPSGPMEDVLNPLHASALIQGFRDGAKLLDTRRATILRQKIEIAKEAARPDVKQLPDYLAPDAPAWRSTVESWRGGSFPFLEQNFDKLGSRITGIDDTTKGKIADTVEEGLRRGYSTLQIANGYDLEGYKGVAGVFSMADDYRAEMIARTEARDAFEAGSLSSYAMAEVPAVEAMDGDEFDEFCRMRDGAVYPLPLEPPR